MAVTDIKLPRELSRLREMAYNLWWTWNSRARRMFSHIEPGLWAHYRNPVELLINIEATRWESLLADDSFLTSYRSVLRDFEAYLKPKETWFKKQHPDYNGGPIAYFSTEFGFHESLRVYSGGLGVLSGDHCKSASDLGIPFVGVGLMYRHGYFEQEVEPDGRQQHFYPNYDFSRLPLLPVCDEHGKQVTVEVDFPDRIVYARAWEARVGRISVYLLDTDTPKNDPADRPITGELYVSGRDMRLCQEIVLGMGGVRLLRALRIQPAAWHMNEGHCAFLALERARERVQSQNISFDDACKQIAVNTVFTTHTPVPAGNEVFEIDLIRKYFWKFCEDVKIPIEKLIELGQSYPGHGAQPFNLTVLALKLSSYANGVSQLHGKVANDMWHHVGKDQKSQQNRIDAITNGVHTETWTGFQIGEMFDKYLTPSWKFNLMDPLFWQKQIANIPDREMWEVHLLQKENLIRFARNRTRNMLARHGHSPDELRAVENLLDPNVLTIGFARRFATYKRADLLFRDVHRLTAILKNKEKPVQIVYAGKAHPADKDGQGLIQRIFNMAMYSELRGHILFIENYDIHVARMLVAGVDVWMNTPRRPREASGTSGQKAAINGAINFSILDGWWCEAPPETGWTIGNGQQFDNPDMQDYEDAMSLYDVLEKQIVPLYYNRDDDGLPMGWINKMKTSITELIPRFSSARMVRDYVEKAYLPAARRAAPVETPAEVAW
jgi:starch phosphorylase